MEWEPKFKDRERTKLMENQHFTTGSSFNLLDLILVIQDLGIHPFNIEISTNAIFGGMTVSLTSTIIDGEAIEIDYKEKGIGGSL